MMRIGFWMVVGALCLYVIQSDTVGCDVDTNRDRAGVTVDFGR